MAGQREGGPFNSTEKGYTYFLVKFNTWIQTVKFWEQVVFSDWIGKEDSMFKNPSIYASVEIDSDAHDNNHAG